MSYLLGLIVVAVLFLAMHYFTELDKKQKLIITAFLVFIVSSAVFYNKYNEAQSDKMLSTVTRFNQGKTIRCANVDINQSNFTLSIGTYTFIGKENTDHFGQMFSASSCQ